MTRQARAACVRARAAGGLRAVDASADRRSQIQPGRYQNHTVTLDGVVTSSWGVPLVPVKLYKIDDGTGEVTVWRTTAARRRRGARVSVTGRVKDVATFGGQAVGLHLQQRDIHFKHYAYALTGRLTATCS